MVCAPARRRRCSRGGWILFRAEREYNGKFNCNCKFNNNSDGNGNADDNCAGGGDGEPGGVEGAAG